MIGLKTQLPSKEASEFLQFALDQLQIDRKDRLGVLRKRALDKCIQQVGLPIDSEDFLHFPLSQIYQNLKKVVNNHSIPKEQLEPFILKECQESHLVIVDGILDKSLSNLDALIGGVWVLSFEEAIRSYGPYLYNRLDQSIQNETNPFALLNIGLQEQGVFIYVPNNMQILEPLQIIYVSTKQTGAIAYPEMMCFLGEKAKLNLVLYTLSLEDDCAAQNIYFDGYLSELAELNIHQYQDQNTSNFHLNHMRFELKSKAKLLTIETSFDVPLQRLSKHVVLTGAYADAQTFGLWSLSHLDLHHNHILMEHVAPHCTSRQLFKGVLKEKARSSFNGKIYVHRDAQKTDAFQLNNNLLIDEKAQAVSKPNLEIFADDVKASHGSTTAMIDPDSLFYLRSRGIDKKLAKQFMVRSHLKEVIEMAFVPSLKEQMLDRIWL